MNYTPNVVSNFWGVVYKGYPFLFFIRISYLYYIELKINKILLINYLSCAILFLYLHRVRHKYKYKNLKNNNMKAIYQTRVEVKGGRNGHVKSDDGVIDLDVRMPKEMGGTESGYTNPEQLFAAGFSACFDGALNLVARQERIKVKDTVVAITVGIGEKDGGFGINAKIEVSIPNIDRAIAEDLMNKAHQVCPYSKATRGNIDVELVLL